MLALHSILNKVLVQRFYRLNAGFFLVVFFLAFGIQQPPSMLISPAFLTGAVTSPMFIQVVLGLFFLYYLKCLNFISKTLAQPESEFLYVAALFPRLHLRAAFALAHLQLFLPALAYTILVSFYGLITGQIVVVVAIILFNLALLLFSSFYFSYRLRQTLPSNIVPNIFTVTEKKLLGHPLLWPLRYLLRQEKVMLVLTKILSLGILYAFLALYPYQPYGIRPTQIGFLMAVTTQAMLVQQMQVFEETELPFLRQLPYSMFWRFGSKAFLFALLLLPEIILIFRFTYYPETFFPVISMYGFGVSFLSLFLGLLYWYRFKQRIYIRTVFLLFISLLLLLLCYPPLYLVVGFLLLVAFLLFRQYYYKYELPED